MYNTFIFDLDGTILNTIQDLKNAVNYVQRKNKVKEDNLDRVKENLGNGITRLLEKSLNIDKNQKEFKNIEKDFYGYYQEHIKDETKPYDNILCIFKKLKANNKKIVICSNKSNHLVKILSDSFFGDLVDFSIGPNEKIKRKPDKEIVDICLENLREQINNSFKNENIGNNYNLETKEKLYEAYLDKKNIIYFGDSEVDFKTATNSNLDYALVSWGFRDRKELEKLNKDKIIDNTKEILDFM